MFETIFVFIACARHTWAMSSNECNLEHSVAKLNCSHPPIHEWTSNFDVIFNLNIKSTKFVLNASNAIKINENLCRKFQMVELFDLYSHFVMTGDDLSTDLTFRVEPKKTANEANGSIRMVIATSLLLLSQQVEGTQTRGRFILYEWMRITFHNLIVVVRGKPIAQANRT